MQVVTKISISFFHNSGNRVSSIFRKCRARSRLEVVVVRGPASALGQVGVVPGVRAAAVAAGITAGPGAASGSGAEVVVVAVPLGLPRVVELALVRAGGRLGVSAAGAAAVVGLPLKHEIQACLSLIDGTIVIKK